MRTLIIRGFSGAVAMVLSLALLTSGCADETAMTGLDREISIAGKKGGGGGNSGPITITMTGGFYTPSDQPAQIISDNRNRTELFHDCHGTELPGCMEYGIDFSGRIGACSTDPADMDPVIQADLQAHLVDPSQLRVFSAVIDKRGGPNSFVKGIYQDDGNGRRYEIRLSDASAEQGSPDHYEIHGPAMLATWTAVDGVGQVLTCEVPGPALTLTVNR